MSKQSLREQHRDLIKTLNRVEGQLKHKYHGFEKVGFLNVMGVDENVRTINDEDSRKEVKQKVETLKDILGGNRRVIAIQGATVQNRFLSERRIKEADVIQSAYNYEHFKLQMAGSHSQYQKKKNVKTGTFEYTINGYNMFGAGIEEPQLGIRLAQTFYIKGTDYSVGKRVPKGLSKEKKQAYLTWLSNNAQVTRAQISSSQQANRYNTLFGGLPFKFDKKQRLGKYQKSIIKALTGKSSVMAITESDEELSILTVFVAHKRKLNKVVKKLKALTPKQFLYLSFRNQDLFAFDYLYSPDDYLGKLYTMSSIIDSFNKMLQDKESVEYQQYQKYLKELGTYYD